MSPRSDERPSSAPPMTALVNKLHSALGSPPLGSHASLRPSPLGHSQTSPLTPRVDGVDSRKRGKTLGIKDKLIREAAGVVKRRDGGVLTRGCVHSRYPSDLADIGERNRFILKTGTKASLEVMDHLLILRPLS